MKIMSKTKYIESPEELWTYFQQYRAWAKDNPYILEVATSKGGVVKLNKERPLSISGFENYLNDQDKICDISDYLRNRDNRYTDFEPVCKRIRSNIYADQLEGAMANIYHHNIVARNLGLVDRKETDIKHIEQPIFNLDEQKKIE
jgi:hypothetical protein